MQSKIFLSGALGLALAACGTPGASSPTASDAEALTQGATPAQFSKFDVNGDGKLDATEVPAEIWDVLKVADADGDGAVTQDEIIDALIAGTFQPKKPHGNGHHPHCPPLWKLDADGDGAISQAEAGQFWPELVQADTDGDGKVTKAELDAAIAAGLFAGPPPRKFHLDFGKLDQDGNGVVTQAEAGPAWPKLVVADADQNGEVTEAEFDAAVQAGLIVEDGEHHHKPGNGGHGNGGPSSGSGPFGGLDANGDGVITQAEAGAAWPKLETADADGNGEVTKDELEAAFGDHDEEGEEHEHDGDELFEKFDANADGFLEQSEVPAELWTKLTGADADADGKVSEDELDAFHEHH